MISLAAQNTEKGADLAAHSVAKIAISMDPEVAFPGQRVRTNTPRKLNNIKGQLGVSSTVFSHLIWQEMASDELESCYVDRTHGKQTFSVFRHSYGNTSG